MHIIVMLEPAVTVATAEGRQRRSVPRPTLLLGTTTTRWTSHGLSTRVGLSRLSLSSCSWYLSRTLSTCQCFGRRNRGWRPARLWTLTSTRQTPWRARPRYCFSWQRRRRQMRRRCVLSAIGHGLGRTCSCSEDNATRLADAQMSEKKYRHSKFSIRA